MVKRGIGKTHGIMADVTRIGGNEVRRAFAFGPDAVVTVGTGIVGLPMIDRRQQWFPTGINMTCLALHGCLRMDSRFGRSGTTVAIHTAATVHEVMVNSRRIRPIGSILVAGLTCVGG
jgi:hypothetical protein